ncbi:hypothetical protein NUW54_g14683 [Trametes sanguinea]|uniref:Uncharacterized protein n=1 Tax=Trametes sanguinea TaxID=158606 RepID=A0ACC1MD01_9APHY|nr:hypothetical protein NUW54_g14683 [Trametes sanguinea]
MAVKILQTYAARRALSVSTSAVQSRLLGGACGSTAETDLTTPSLRSDNENERKLRPSANRTDEEEPPAKMKKLAIVEEREEDKYEYKTVLKCWKCDPENGLEIPDASNDPHSEVKAWEEEITACEHTLMLEQQATGPIAASGLAHCTKCDLKENLWLCLTCGSRLRTWLDWPV